VLRAIHHQPADRVPIDLGGTRQSGIAASTYHRLKPLLGVDSPTRVYDVYQMLAEVDRPVMERFGADVVGLNRRDVAFGIRNENFKPWTMFDGTPVEVPGGFEPVTEEDGSWCCCATASRSPACPRTDSTSTASKNSPAPRTWIWTGTSRRG
jgi:uroporphyrinogen decarboxylase